MHLPASRGGAGALCIHATVKWKKCSCLECCEHGVGSTIAGYVTSTWKCSPKIRFCDNEQGFVRWMHTILLLFSLVQLQQELLDWFCHWELNLHCRNIPFLLFSSQILARVEGSPAAQGRWWRVRKPTCTLLGAAAPTGIFHGVVCNRTVCKIMHVHVKRDIINKKNWWMIVWRASYAPNIIPTVSRKQKKKKNTEIVKYQYFIVLYIYI